MPDDPPLTPATPEEVAMALAYALRFNGRKAFRKGDELMAEITAEHLIRHLDLAGFVVMRKPGAKSHGTPAISPGVG